MNFVMIVRLLTYAVLLCGISLHAVAQTGNTKTLNVDYGKTYQLQDSYSIIYDNTAQIAKLKEFRVTFYNPLGENLAETEIETHPITGTIETYRLSAPVSGFSKVELSILSLHGGNMEAFPSDIGEILALNELTAVPEAELAPLETQVSDNADLGVAGTDPVPPPTLSEAEKQRLAAVKSGSIQLLLNLQEKTAELTASRNTQVQNSSRISELVANIEAISDQTVAVNVQEPKSQADILNANIASELSLSDMTKATEELQTLETQILTLQSQIETLQDLSESDEFDPLEIISSVEGIETELSDLNTSLTSLNLPKANETTQIDAWEADYLSLKTLFDESPSSGFDWRIMTAAILVGFALLALAVKFLPSINARSRPLKSTLYRTDPGGVIFPASPMLAGNVAAPLSASGQLTAAQLQMLTGPYTVLRDAYQATGRIGYAQEGAPTAEDYSFGTGFLISDRHVITNRHVHGLYGHYLLDKTDPGGIEFVAEKEKDASDFVPFNCEPPLLLPALDIAIYKLAHPVQNRKPIALNSIKTETLNGREIVVIGYPDTHTPEAADIKAVVEEDAVFAVKRISQGHIFRHSTDIDKPFGVETQVTEDKNISFAMPAICHNASTLGGNSGSPLLDVKSGELLGVHFAGFKVFNKEEAANLAIAIAQLTNETSKNNLSTVMNITS